MSLQDAITSLGDFFPAGCVGAAMTLWCWARLNRLVGMVFAICWGGAVVSVLGLKLGAIAYAAPLEGASIFTITQGAPSGHAALATVVYGCAAVIFLNLRPALPALSGAAACLIAAASVYVTRVTLHTHTIPDVGAGILVGAFFVFLFWRALKVQILRRPTTGAWSLLLIMGATALLALASGIRLTSDRFL